jgi:hypothetical protein
MSTTKDFTMIFSKDFEMRLACHLEEKTTLISFRASKSLQKVLQENAAKKSVSVSNYLRDLIYESLRS